jgi:uncharacterized membrane protein
MGISDKIIYIAYGGGKTPIEFLAGLIDAAIQWPGQFASYAEACDLTVLAVVHWLPATLILVEISAYEFLLKTFGFVISTLLVVLFVMLVNLRIRSIRVFLGMPIGITLSCWLIFEKALGIYLSGDPAARRTPAQFDE